MNNTPSFCNKIDKKSPKLILLLHNSEPFLFGCQLMKFTKINPSFYTLINNHFLVVNSCWHSNYFEHQCNGTSETYVIDKFAIPTLHCILGPCNRLVDLLESHFPEFSTFTKRASEGPLQQQGFQNLHTRPYKL